MRDDEFWAIIADAGRSDDPVEGLAAELRGCADDDVIDFDSRLHTLLRRCWSEDLWQLADLVVDGLDDASFEYFRLWLVFQGRATFEAVLADPDHLAGVPVGPEGCQLDGPQFVAWLVYRRSTGCHMPARRRSPAHLRPLSAAGRRSAAARFPRTAADRARPAGP